MIYSLTYKYRDFFLFLLVTTALILFSCDVLAQTRYRVYEDYIEMYSDIAVKHMQRYNIPASITLAQGLLESGAGKSSLTIKSNNHFGIKCHRNWKGKRVYAKDDGPNDCFRKYNKAEESFEDHSVFLTSHSRYANLFTLEITDYRAWAKGLQKSGYATDRAYANKLIKLIEDYKLYRYDDIKYRKKHRERRVNKSRSEAKAAWRHQPYKTHGLIYILAIKGDTFESIADEFGFKAKKLRKYNEVPEDFPLNEGDIVYFQKKKSIADKPYYQHEVQIGESMHSIAQLYGMKVRNLYRINKKTYDYVPEEGSVLRLR